MMATNTQQDAHKLEADAKVDLFEIHLATGGCIYLKKDNDVTWQGKSYEGHPIELTGAGKDSGEQSKRPQLQLANPDGVFKSYIHSGALDRALVVRHRVLKQDMLANHNVSEKQQWLLTRVASSNRKMVICELRDLTDGPNFITPARMFIPPEFPLVNLT